LLLKGHDNLDKMLSIGYIGQLLPDPSITFFFGGYCSCPIDDPNQGWLMDEWSAEQANETFEKLISQCTARTLMESGIAGIDFSFDT
jgi:hypothetical protein